MRLSLARKSSKWRRIYLIAYKILKRDILLTGRKYTTDNKIPLNAGFLFYMLLIVMLVMPPAFLNATPAHAQGIMRWEIVPTPGYYQLRFDIVSPGDIIDFAVGSGGRVVAVVRIPETTTPAGYQNVIYVSNDNGITWSDSAYNALQESDWLDNEIFNVAIAPDNPDEWAITAGIAAEGYAPKHVWYTDNGGVQWVDTMLTLTGAAETIRSVDISPTYGTGWHDIGVTTVTGTGAGSYYIVSSKTWGLWLDQGTQGSALPVAAGSADYFKIRFSPSYVSDFSVALVYATTNATYFNVGFRDVNRNTTLNYAFQNQGIEVRNTAMPPNASPGLAQLVIADLKLPQDFLGQSATLRRAYVSLDSNGSKSATSQDGVYRVDDTHVYVLMDTTNPPDKSIYSIAYYGTFAQGKLLVAEHHGYPCTATVPTWFTDSPTVCPIPCWYPALKPTTGAAAQGFTPGPIPGMCPNSKVGVGSGRAAWDEDGTLAYAGTGSLDTQAGSAWYSKLLGATIKNDESAFSISRNNGETWNQIGLIDTTMDWLNDVAPSADCGTLYLASVNHNTGACSAFDSVWRSTLNSKVSNPLPPSQFMGFYWERVLCHPTSISCNVTQSDAPIIRVPMVCNDRPDGEIVAWAARLTTAQMWSPDYGDYWAEINSTDLIQDFTFEKSDTIYDLTPGGLVQKLTYSGTSWITKYKRADSRVIRAHTIAAIPDGKILVGAATSDVGSSVDAASFSPTGGDQWIEIPRGSTQIGNVHVAFDAAFSDNKFVYLADDKRNEAGSKIGTYAGSIFREEVPAYIRLDDADLMSDGNSAHAEVNWPPKAANGRPLSDPPHPVGQFGVVAARTGLPQPAVYTAHDIITTTLGRDNSAVCRTLRPWQAMPKYGIPWDCLDIFSPPSTENITFTLEPSSLKYCGCCTMDSHTTLFAIDNMSGGTFGVDGYDPTGNQGMLWAYTDCLAKKGPVLITPEDGGFVGSDPVTGRNQQIDLSWEQLCVAITYELQLAKDRDFAMKVNPAITGAGGRPTITAVTGSITINLDELNMTRPKAWISPGTLPEAGASYYWRLRVIKSSTGQLAVSPWSETRSFSIKPGFVVKTPVKGIQLLNPIDKCAGCPVTSVALSWTPVKEATKYEVWLARDAEFQKMIKKATTTSTAYQYPETLEYSTSYFWRVRAIEVNGISNIGDWSGTFTFSTVNAPAPEPTKEEKEKQQEKQQNPGYAWVVIAIIAAVPIFLLVFIVLSRKPRY